jgi:Nucleotidyl transferase AbiEii toxin, Type IV TA system
MSELTEFQRAVARAFFSLDAARDFVLTGGAALLAHDLTTRVTGDLDLFSTTAQHIDDAVAAFVAEAERNDWPVIIVRQSATFARIEVGETTGGHLVIDLGVDSAPILDTTVTDVGPTYQPQELAARKLLALFGRAEARDICDCTNSRFSSTSTISANSPVGSTPDSAGCASPMPSARSIASPTVTSRTSASRPMQSGPSPTSGDAGCSALASSRLLQGVGECHTLSARSGRSPPAPRLDAPCERSEGKRSRCRSYVTISGVL